LKLVKRANQKALVAFFKSAAGEVDVFRAYAFCDLFDTDAKLR
jgi:hypothetical protein